MGSQKSLSSDIDKMWGSYRDTPELKKRALVLKDTVYSKLTARQKSSMAQNPTAGLVNTATYVSHKTCV